MHYFAVVPVFNYTNNQNYAVSQKRKSLYRAHD